MKAMRRFGILVMFAVALVGCGGNSSNTSPLSGTSLSDAGRKAGGATAAKNTKSDATVPVFLTIDPALDQDYWIELNAVHLQSADASVEVVKPSKATMLRLASLRDVQGRRFLYLGHVSRSGNYVRARMELGAQVTVKKVGDELPTKPKLVGPAVAEGGETATLSLNLDPNAEFQDALVLELKMDSSDKGIAPSLLLGSASDALNAERQVLRLVIGQVKQYESSKLVLKTKAGEEVLELAGGGDGVLAPKKGDSVAVVVAFDSKLRKSMVRGIGPVAEGAVAAWGIVQALDEKSRTMILETSQSPQFDDAAWTVALPEGKKWEAEVGQWVLVVAEKKEQQWLAVSISSELPVAVAQPAKAPETSGEKSEPKSTSTK